MADHQISRRHHTVPRFLLERFADERSRLTCVRLPGDVRFPISTKDATVENGFHLLLDEQGQEVDDFERWVSTIEDLAAPAITRMLGGAFPPSEDDRNAIAVLVALQYLRTPAVREHEREARDAVWKLRIAVEGKAGARRRLLNHLGREPTPEEIDRAWALVEDPNTYRLAPSGLGHIKTILAMLPGTAAQFRDRAWTLVRWRRRSLIVSDTPVVLVGDNGDTSPGLAYAAQVLIALDRRWLLRLGNIGEGDALAEGTTSLANDINAVFAWHARKALFHHPDDAELVAKLQLHGPVVGEIDAGYDFQRMVEMGERIRTTSEDARLPGDWRPKNQAGGRTV